MPLRGQRCIFATFFVGLILNIWTELKSPVDLHKTGGVTKSMQEGLCTFLNGGCSRTPSVVLQPICTSDISWTTCHNHIPPSTACRSLHNLSLACHCNTTPLSRECWPHSIYALCESTISTCAAAFCLPHFCVPSRRPHLTLAHS